LKARYAYLLEDEGARRWFDNLAAKSYVTATVYLRTLGLYCELNYTNPKTMLQIAGSKALRDGFSDFVKRLERAGKAGCYIARFKKVLHSWLSYDGLNVKLKVNIARIKCKRYHKRRGEEITKRKTREKIFAR
jgi:hypothetical protein